MGTCVTTTVNRQVFQIPTYLRYECHYLIPMQPFPNPDQPGIHLSGHATVIWLSLGTHVQCKGRSLRIFRVVEAINRPL